MDRLAGLSSYRDFEVFKKAYQLSLELHKFSVDLPHIEQRALADQMRRSSKSVCVNFAEGFAKQKYSNNEFRKYLVISLGSANETIVWLNYCKDLKYLEELQYIIWSKGYEEVARMIQGLIKSLNKSGDSSR